MMGWKGFGRKSWPNFKVQHSPGGTEENQEAKVWSIVPRTACTEVVIAVGPFGAPGSIPLYACLSSVWGCDGGNCLIPYLSWEKQTTRKLKQKQ
jgi:hypothetical protein